MTTEIPVITVDGPSGTGKGTLCGYLARMLGWHLLDSGALYRVVAHAAAETGTGLDDGAALARIAAGLDVSFREIGGQIHAYLGQDLRDITAAIRTESCGNAASRVAACEPVRHALLERQRAFLRLPGLIADGRDMGTVIFPRAPLKIYLTADPEERAGRRYKQLNEKGISVNLQRLSAEIRERDARDAGRKISPLKPAPDAIVIDTTSLDINAVCQRVAGEVRNSFPDYPADAQ